MLDLGHIALEKEQLVAENAATNRCSRVFEAVVIRFRTIELGQVGVGERLLPISAIARVHRAAGEFVLDEPMEIVRTAYGGYVHHAASGAAVLGILSCTPLLNLHFELR